MATIFLKIIQGEIPSYKIAENEKYFAFLDINPLSEGHTLVVPKKEVDYIFDLDMETYEGLFLFVRKVGKAIQEHIPCKRLGIVGCSGVESGSKFASSYRLGLNAAGRAHPKRFPHAGRRPKRSTSRRLAGVLRV